MNSALGIAPLEEKSSIPNMSRIRRRTHSAISSQVYLVSVIFNRWMKYHFSTYHHTLLAFERKIVVCYFPVVVIYMVIYLAEEH